MCYSFNHGYLHVWLKIIWSYVWNAHLRHHEYEKWVAWHKPAMTAIAISISDDLSSYVGSFIPVLWFYRLKIMTFVCSCYGMLTKLQLNLINLRNFTISIVSYFECSSFENFNFCMQSLQKILKVSWCILSALKAYWALFVICAPQAGSPFRDPLVKFLARYPDVTIELFLTDAHLRDQQWTRLFEVSNWGKGGDGEGEGWSSWPDTLTWLWNYFLLTPIWGTSNGQGCLR